MMGGDGGWESTCKTQGCLLIQTVVGVWILCRELTISMYKDYLESTSYKEGGFI